MKTDKWVNQPLITVITIVYNGINELESTIQSIITQTYPNIEYIIIDGASNDGTIDIIKKYQNKISKWVSEKDDGIYDAMNKGILLSTGEYINFMNSGDIFINENIINNFVEFITTKKYLEKEIVFCGNNLIKFPNCDIVCKADINNIEIWHQSVFIFSKIQKENLFDKRFKIAGDYELWFRLISKNISFIKLDFIVAKYDGLGLSFKNISNAVIEAWIAKKINFHDTNLFELFYKLIIENIKNYAKRILNFKFYFNIKKIFNKRNLY